MYIHKFSTSFLATHMLHVFKIFRACKKRNNDTYVIFCKFYIPFKNMFASMFSVIQCLICEQLQYLQNNVRWKNKSSIEFLFMLITVLDVYYEDEEIDVFNFSVKACIFI